MTDTLGQTVDAELAVVKARLAVLESAAKTDFAKAKAWLGSNLPHFVTWAGLVAAASKMGLLKI